MHRYFIGYHGEFGLDRLFAFDSESRIEESAVLNSFRAALKGAGFKALPEHEHGTFARLGIEWQQVHSFRGQEVELPDRLTGVDLALKGIGPHEVLVIASTFSHDSGHDYDHVLLAMPKGSRVQHHGFMGDPNVTCDKDVNRWMAFNDQMRGHRACLTPNTREWDEETNEWIPCPELVYGYVDDDPDGDDDA